MTDHGIIELDDARLAALAGDLLSRCDALPGRRYVLGVAGIPGSGKSTLAARLVAETDRLRPGAARLVPMDGFHLTNRRLEELGLRKRKGSPPTFDVAAYIDLLKRAREAGAALRFPVYDRGLHEPVMGDGPDSIIGPAVRLIVTEGNYLLLKESPWNELARVLDACWLLQTDPRLAREWIIARHVRGGRPPEDAARHYEGNDALNAELIASSSREPDLRLRWKQE